MFPLLAVQHNWFPVGSLQFIALAAVVLIAVMILSETRRGTYATLLLGGFLLVGHLLGDMKLHQYVWEHPLYLPCIAVAYYLIGVGWSFIRWASHLRTEADQLLEDKDEWIRQHAGVGGWSNGKKIEKPQDAEQAWWNHVQEARPRAKNNKALIITWMSYWPLSFVWTVANDPVRRGFEYLYGQVAHVFENMSVSAWSRFQQPKPPEPKIDPEATVRVALPSLERIERLEGDANGK